MPDLLLDLDLDFGLSRSSGRRRALEQALRSAIGDGRLDAGAHMPSTRSLAADLGISRSTVVGAYEQLAIEGYLVTRQGARTRVARTRLPAAVPERSAGGGRPLRYDFRPGSPAVGLFPRGAWLRSARTVLQTAPDSAFDYGDPRGSATLRAELASYLARARAVAGGPESVRIYGGFFAAVSFIGEAFGALGQRRIAVEEPSLHVVRDSLARTGLSIAPVPVDERGIIVDSLEALDVDAVLVTPSHQYPTGVTMAPERRRELIGWARAGDRWIIEDDYDGEFRYDRQPVGVLQGLAPDRVIYAGTASKTLAPGLRLAWLVVPEGFRPTLDRVTHLRAGVSTIDQLTLADLMHRGELDRRIRLARAVYRRRRETLTDRLARIDWLEPWGSTPAGLHLTVVSDRLDEESLVAAAAAEGIGLLGLGVHWHGQTERRGLVLGFTRPPEHGFPEAVDQLFRFLESPPAAGLDR